jgi:hypothetical protein
MELLSSAGMNGARIDLGDDAPQEEGERAEVQMTLRLHGSNLLYSRNHSNRSKSKSLEPRAISKVGDD